ncbi:MAG: hypothetical protein RMK20_07005 [Verrucomicrobiales bacterium]|nr:hypothetical protein [Verrucomicrobiales bacterium]
MTNRRRLPPLFAKPFPTAAEQWLDFDDSTINLWTAWSQGTPVADVDFRTTIRSPIAAFSSIATNYAAAAGEIVPVTLPPAPPVHYPRALNRSIATLTPDGDLTLYAATPTPEGLTVLVWASDFYPDRERPNPDTFQFLARLDRDPDPDLNLITGDTRPAFAARWPNLSAFGGQWLALMPFQFSEGHLFFLGGVPCQLPTP